MIPKGRRAGLVMDLHIYGGTALVVWGGWSWLGWTGPLFGGIVLLTLGLMRTGP